MSDALEVTVKPVTHKPARKVKSAGVTGITGAARARATRQANQAGDHFRYKLVLNAWMIEQFGFSALPCCPWRRKRSRCAIAWIKVFF